MYNYKLVIRYDGTNYSGWQIQANAPSVQGTISEALKILLKTEVNLIGSGRTDTGVHAIGQAANFRYDGTIDIYRFRHSLNSILPFDISVTEISEVPESFHARFDAKRRSYFYLITTYKDPILRNYSYHYFDKIFVPYLNELSHQIEGRHDFRSFSKKSGDIENTYCTIYSAGWRMIKGIVVFVIEADRYLHGMVRAITGTLLELSQKPEGSKRLKEIIEQNDRAYAGEGVPAKGLFLYKVKY